MKPMAACWTRRLLSVLACTIPTHASAFFVDGSGHYGLLGETQTKPAFSDQEGTYQAIQQSFRITGEARMNDRSSAFMELRLFPDLREAYLGDTSSPPECAPSTGTSYDGSLGVETDCADRYQDPIEPGYQPYDPRITKAYIRYAFDWCIIEAGRRDRDWGLGIFMDSGEDPFETAATIYDGIDCQVNIQKSQTIGFSIGYDKLQETGTTVDPALDPNFVPGATARRFGSNEPADDLDQYFFSIEWDDRKANAGAAFTKHIGIYFAQISSAKEIQNGGTNTDIKILDLYTGFFLSDLAFRNEILFRMGKSAAPSFARLGGAYPDDRGVETHKVQSIAIAGDFEWTLARSGAAIGPAEYNRGDATRHVWFFDYAYAPGDPEGYYQEGTGDPEFGNARRNKDDNKVEAIEFHRNYKPALILFNARPESDHLREDGVFNPSRVVNAAVFGTGYRFESMEGGNFEVKLLTATLNEKVPGDLKDFWNQRKAMSDEQINDGLETGNEADVIAGRALDGQGSRPAGFFGRTLGYELDLKYTYKVGREAALGMSAAAAVPGDAWKVSTDFEPKNNFLLQSFVTFQF